MMVRKPRRAKNRGGQCARVIVKEPDLGCGPVSWLVWGALALTLVTAWPDASFAGPGFDCKLAHSAVEHLICSDNALVALDTGQAARYERLRRASSPDGAARLLVRQRAWLVGRAGCIGGLNNDRSSQIDCLTRIYQDPGSAFDAQFRVSEALVLEERHTDRHLAQLRVVESDSHPWLTGFPESRAAAFNKYVSERCELRKSMFAAAPVELDAKPEGTTQYDRFYEIHHMDGKLISIEMFMHHESYYGHGWRSEFALNWDLRLNRPLDIAALFRPGLDWQSAVMDQVRKWVHEEDYNDSLVDLAEPESDESWLFDSDGAILLIGRGERSMAGASADVPIPYDVLIPFLVPDAPLPVRRTQ
jgi:uncharacterized protein